MADIVISTSEVLGTRIRSFRLPGGVKLNIHVNHGHHNTVSALLLFRGAILVMAHAAPPKIYVWDDEDDGDSRICFENASFALKPAVLAEVVRWIEENGVQLRLPVGEGR